MKDINTNKKVIACVDRSAYAEHVVAWAAWSASRLGLSLEILHIIDRELHKAQSHDHSGAMGINEREQLLEKLSADDEAKGRLAREQARAFVSDLRSVAQQQYPDLEIDTRLRIDSLAGAIQEHQTGAELLVLGRKGSGHEAGGRLGSADTVSSKLGKHLEETVRSLQRPVLVVGGAHTLLKRVLVAFDGSAMSRRAVDTVARSGMFQDIEVHLLSVHEQGTKTIDVRTVHAQLERAGISAVSACKEGDFTEQLALYVQQNGIDMVLMGAYSHSVWRSLFSASKTTEVLQAVSVPTLLLRV